MRDMQKIQPKIAKLREELKDNPQKLNKEMMELYRSHKVNPFGGCLPMFLQIPVFFALFKALYRSLELYKANFLWIKDLSQPDALIRFSQPLPIIGDSINILPILMIIGMILQQKVTHTGTGTLSPQQKQMGMFFPIFIGFIFYQFSAGLVLYWLTNTAIMTLYQWRLTRKA
jgi:YidC/Oxa1 family membrane protein insertase